MASTVPAKVLMIQDKTMIRANMMTQASMMIPANTKAGHN
jgi:hypothetical protein